MGALYYTLPDRPIVIGRDIKCDITIEYPFISRQHLRILPHSNSLTAELFMLGSNTTLINGVPISKGDKTIIGRSDFIEIGETTICWLGKVIFINIDNGCDVKTSLLEVSILDIRDDEVRDNKGFTPAVRIDKPYNLTPIEIEGPPARRLPEKPSLFLAAGPALTMALPILLGAGRKISVITSIFAALWAVLNVTNHKRKGKNEERRRRASYTAYIREKDEEIRIRHLEYQKSQFYEYPAIDEYFVNSGNPFILWNRYTKASDLLNIRIGVGNLKSPIDIKVPKDKFAQLDDSLKELPGKLKDKYDVLSSAPISLKLDKGEIIGIVGKVGKQGIFDKITLDIINAILLEIMVSATPELLRIMIDTKSALNGYDLSAITWSPHYIGSEEDNWLITYKSELNSDKDIGKLLIYITTDADVAMSYANEYLATVLLIADRLTHLPSGVDRILTLDGNFIGLIDINGGTSNRTKVNFDRIGYVQMKEYVRKLLSLAKGIGVGSKEIPQMVDFGRLYDGTLIDGESIIANWKSCDVNKSIGFPIGMGSNDKVISLDICDKRHGPHGLVSGSTGSGKSELLTTIVLSAALCYPPDKLGFFLIDYKGGSMSNLFEALPHLMGSISNLSKEESKRAMISLYSENLRRQELFNKCRVSSITEYIAGYDEGRFKDALPHILIIIDEFAQLKKEEPEFMQQLISIAAVGRSLGVHLLLATQKPSGVIDDKIRSNAHFRISLRVEDKSDSMDMLKTVDAADIVQSGRAYFQVGNNEVYEQFQSAYAFSQFGNYNGGKLTIYDEAGNKIKIQSKKEDTKPKTTWYEHLMCEIASAYGSYDKKNVYISPLWLPSLRDDINLLELSGKSIALADAPHKHRYIDVEANLSAMGHICILGKSGSGKTNLISAILLRNLETADVYIIDFGGGGLEEYKKSNRCGGYIDSENPRRIKMLLNYLEEVFRYRSKSEAVKLRSILLVIDNIGEAIKGNEEHCIRIINKILKHGRRIEMYILVSASSVGTEEIPSRLFDNVNTKIILGDYDIYQVANYLKVKASMVPKVSDTAGRGVTIVENEVLTIQTGAVNGMITDVIKTVNSRKTPKTPLYPYLPEDLTLDYFLKRALSEIAPIDTGQSLNFSSRKMGVLPLGYEEDSGKIFYLNLSKVSCLLIGGRKGSGKKSLCRHAGVMGSRYGLSVCNINDPKVLIDQIHNADLIIIDDLLKVLSVFYNNPHTTEDEEIIASALRNDRNCKDLAMIIAIVDDRIKSELRGTMILDAIMFNPYAICLGGALDENKLFDYSYMSYSQLSRKKAPGYGTALRSQGMGFYGDVVIPAVINEDI